MNPTRRQIDQIGGYQITPYRGRMKIVGITAQTQKRDFSLGRLSDGRWETSLLSTGGKRPPRKQFVATDLEQAFRVAEEHWFVPVELVRNPNPEGLRIDQVFVEWLDVHPAHETTIQQDYLPRAERFSKWARSKGLFFWRDLLPKHLQEYANEGAHRHRRSTIEKLCRVVRMASEFVRDNYPEHYHPLPIRLPKGRDWGKPKGRATLTIEEAVEFLFFVREQENGWNTLPGFALAALASARVQEVRKLRWSSVDLASGVVAFEVDPKAGVQSFRRIPVTGLLVDILDEARGRWNAAPEDLVVPTHKKDSFGQAFRRYRDKWRPGLKIEPYGLRRTLVKAFVLLGLHGYTLEIYRGHKPTQISDVEWRYYLDRLEMDPKGLSEMFRRQVVGPLDEILEPHRRKWNTAPGKVIRLLG